MIYKVPSDPNRSMIPWFMYRTVPTCPAAGRLQG